MVASPFATRSSASARSTGLSRPFTVTGNVFRGKGVKVLSYEVDVLSRKGEEAAFLSMAGAYADLCQRITDALARISYNNERIADIKAAGQLSDDEVDETEPVDGEPVAEEPSCCCGCEEPAAEDDKPEE